MGFENMFLRGRKEQKILPEVNLDYERTQGELREKSIFNFKEDFTFMMVPIDSGWRAEHDPTPELFNLTFLQLHHQTVPGLLPLEANINMTQLFLVIQLFISHKLPVSGGPYSWLPVSPNVPS